MSCAACDGYSLGANWAGRYIKGKAINKWESVPGQGVLAKAEDSKADIPREVGTDLHPGGAVRLGGPLPALAQVHRPEDVQEACATARVPKVLDRRRR